MNFLANPIVRGTIILPHFTISFEEKEIPRYKLSGSKAGRKRKIKKPQHLIKEKMDNKDEKLAKSEKLLWKLKNELPRQPSPPLETNSGR